MRLQLLPLVFISTLCYNKVGAESDIYLDPDGSGDLEDDQEGSGGDHPMTAYKSDYGDYPYTDDTEAGDDDGDGYDEGSGRPYDGYDYAYDEDDFFDDNYRKNSPDDFGDRPEDRPTDKINLIYVEEDIILPETKTAIDSAPPQPSSTKPPPTLIDNGDDEMDNSVTILTQKGNDRQVSVFAQPGILAAFIGGAVVGLLCAILLVMFIVYRMRKKDEGSYPLDEPKRMPLTASYSPNDKEIYA